LGRKKIDMFKMTKVLSEVRKLDLSVPLSLSLTHSLSVSLCLCLCQQMKSVAELQSGLGKSELEDEEGDDEEDDDDDTEKETQKKKKRLTKIEKQMNGREHLRREAAQQKEKEIKKKKSAKKAAAKDPSHVKRQTALSKPVELSSKLSEFLGYSIVPRTEVTKLMWKYIKEHELQNPEKKQVIVCDEKMEQLFDKKQFTMFEMTKYLNKVTILFVPPSLPPSPAD
jgi:upstream activation factor subunit UAF30